MGEVGFLRAKSWLNFHHKASWGDLAGKVLFTPLQGPSVFDIVPRSVKRLWTFLPGCTLVTSMSKAHHTKRGTQDTRRSFEKHWVFETNLLVQLQQRGCMPPPLLPYTAKAQCPEECVFFLSQVDDVSNEVFGLYALDACNPAGLLKQMLQIQPGKQMACQNCQGFQKSMHILIFPISWHIHQPP